MYGRERGGVWWSYLTPLWGGGQGVIPIGQLTHGCNYHIWSYYSEPGDGEHNTSGSEEHGGVI